MFQIKTRSGSKLSKEYSDLDSARQVAKSISAAWKEPVDIWQKREDLVETIEFRSDQPNPVKDNSKGETESA